MYSIKVLHMRNLSNRYKPCNIENMKNTKLTYSSFDKGKLHHKGSAYVYYMRNNGIIVRNCFHPGVSSINEDNFVNPKQTSSTSSKDMLRVMVSYIWPKDDASIKKDVKISLALLIAAKVTNVSVPFIFKYAVDDLTSLSSSGEFLSNISPMPNAIFALSSSLLIGYGIARVCASGFNELRNAIFAKVAQHSIRKIACNVFKHLHGLDLSFHLSRQTGALSKAIDRGSRGINFVLTALVFNIVPTIFELGLVSTILVFPNVTTGAIFIINLIIYRVATYHRLCDDSDILGIKYGVFFSTLSVGCVLLYAVFTLLTTKWRTRFRIHMNKAENEAGNKAIDSLINYETVKYFCNERHEVERYNKALEKYEEASLKTSSSLAFLNFGQNIIFSTAISVAMVFAANEILTGSMTIGDLVMINGLLFQLSMPLSFLGSVYREVRQAFTDMQAMFALVNNTRRPLIKISKNEIIEYGEHKVAVEFRDVHFHYVKDKPIFSGLTFSIPTGKKVAIVGASGTGKSSIVRLLYRFYEPVAGEIIIFDKKMTYNNVEASRKTIAVVPQDSVLFNESILYNLQYGNFEKSVDDIHNAAVMADIHNTILKWPDGYQTQVGERGLKLSGGEKQRVAIARAILKDSPIFIFDEATSSLDSITEYNIMRALKMATKGKTSICIAHRLSTVMDADEIFVLQEGKLLEHGAHIQLLNDENSLYRKLWNMQQTSSSQSLLHR